MFRISPDRRMAATWGLVATAVLGLLIVLGSRNLNHFDAALVGYTFATLFATFGITYRYMRATSTLRPGVRLPGLHAGRSRRFVWNFAVKRSSPRDSASDCCDCQPSLHTRTTHDDRQRHGDHDGARRRTTCSAPCLPKRSAAPRIALRHSSGSLLLPFRCLRTHRVQGRSQGRACSPWQCAQL